MNRAWPRRRAGALVGVLSAVLCAPALGCSDEPSVTVFGPAAELPATVCDGGKLSCINAGVEERSVDGVHLIHKRVQAEPTVAVRLVFDSGAVDLGVRDTLAQSIGLTLMSWWGFNSGDALTFQRQLAELGSSFWTDTDYETTTLGLVTTPGTFEAAWELVLSAFRDPVVYDEGVQLVYDQRLAWWNARFDEPRRAANETAWQALFAGHPYVESSDYQAVVVPRVSDVREVLAQLRARDALTVAVVGDISLARVEAAIEGGLGGLPSASQRPTLALQQLDETAAGAQLLDYPDSPAWHFSGYFPAPNPASQDYRALSLGLAVLDDRLFDEVRERRSLVYNINLGAGFLTANFGWYSMSTAWPVEALQAVRDVFVDFLTEPLSQRELDSERSKLVTRYLDGLQSSSSMVWTLTAYEIYAGDRRVADKWIEELESVTAEQVQQQVRIALGQTQFAVAGPSSELTEEMLLELVRDL